MHVVLYLFSKTLIPVLLPRACLVAKLLVESRHTQYHRNRQYINPSNLGKPLTSLEPKSLKKHSARCGQRHETMVLIAGNLRTMDTDVKASWLTSLHPVNYNKPTVLASLALGLSHNAGVAQTRVAVCWQRLAPQIVLAVLLHP